MPQFVECDGGLYLRDRAGLKQRADMVILAPCLAVFVRENQRIASLSGYQLTKNRGTLGVERDMARTPGLCRRDVDALCAQINVLGLEGNQLAIARSRQ